jgi:hypothetical protein
MDMNNVMPVMLVKRVHNEIAQGLLGMNCRLLNFHGGVLPGFVFMSPEVLAAGTAGCFLLAPSCP